MAYHSVFRPDLFAGRHIVVTGGGSGIGRCTAHELAALGTQVALVEFRNIWRLVPLKRLGTESEVSAAIVFPLSEAASFISGSCLRVDGAVPNVRPNFSVPDHAKSRPYRAFPLESPPEFLRRDDADVPA